MKTLLTILFSLALLGTQSVFIVGAPLGPPVSHCACDKCVTSCCKKKASSDSQPLPYAPVRSSAQSEWQFLAAVTTQLATRLTSSESEVFFRFLPPVSAAAVPLYQRNCSFLI